MHFFIYLLHLCFFVSKGVRLKVFICWLITPGSQKMFIVVNKLQLRKKLQSILIFYQKKFNDKKDKHVLTPPRIIKRFIQQL